MAAMGARRLDARISAEALDGWWSTSREAGSTVTGLLEALGLRLGQDERMRARLARAVQQQAQDVDARRRRRS